MKKVRPTKPTAIGAYVFAGGFSLGVSKHFKLLMHVENGKFGAETCRKNFDITVETDIAKWPEKMDVDFVFCNPPCAPWSNASSGRAAHWKDDPRTSCVGHCFDLLIRWQPKVWCFESVRNAYTKGREMIDEMVDRAAELGYRATHLLVDGQEHGVPQTRKRYFLVLSKYAIVWEPTHKEHNLPCGPVFKRGLPTEPHYDLGEMGRKLAKHMGPGQGMAETFNRLYPRKIARAKESAARGESKKVSGRPGFLYLRIDPNKPSGVIAGGVTKLHPEEDRFISVAESAALCGFPESYEFVGGMGDAYAQIGKGVMPPVGEYVGSMAAKAIRDKIEFVDAQDTEEAWIYHDKVIVKYPSIAGKADPRIIEPTNWREQMLSHSAKVLIVDPPPVSLAAIPRSINARLSVTIFDRPLRRKQPPTGSRIVYDKFGLRDATMLKRFDHGVNFTGVIHTNYWLTNDKQSLYKLKTLRDLSHPGTGVVFIRVKEHDEEVVKKAGMRIVKRYKDRFGNDGTVMLMRVQEGEETRYVQRAFQSRLTNRFDLEVEADVCQKIV